VFSGSVVDIAKYFSCSFCVFCVFSGESTVPKFGYSSGYSSFVVDLRCSENSEVMQRVTGALVNPLHLHCYLSVSAIRYFDHEEMGCKRRSGDKLTRSQI
jgi:hypothetical protein